jgi:hypothetical protein
LDLAIDTILRASSKAMPLRKLPRFSTSKNNRFLSDQGLFLESGHFFAEKNENTVMQAFLKCVVKWQGQNLKQIVTENLNLLEEWRQNRRQFQDLCLLIHNFMGNFMY